MKLIILDRDGVINHDSKDFIKSEEEWIPYPESLKACQLLCDHGYTIAVASNQSGIGRNYFDLTTLAAIHRKMFEMVQEAGGRINKVFFCPHLAEDLCDCRKPKNGLFKQISAHYGVPLNHVPAIGDSWRDIQASAISLCHPILVKTGNGEKTIKEHAKALSHILIFDNLLQASQYLCQIPR